MEFICLNIELMFSKIQLSFANPDELSNKTHRHFYGLGYYRFNLNKMMKYFLSALQCEHSQPRHRVVRYPVSSEVSVSNGAAPSRQPHPTGSPHWFRSTGPLRSQPCKVPPLPNMLILRYAVEPGHGGCGGKAVRSRRWVAMGSGLQIVRCRS